MIRDGSKVGHFGGPSLAAVFRRAETLLLKFATLVILHLAALFRRAEAILLLVSLGTCGSKKVRATSSSDRYHKWPSIFLKAMSATIWLT